jgi:hypothetical protein
MEFVAVIGIVIVLGGFCIAIFAQPLRLAAKKAGAIVRVPQAQFLRKSDFCVFGVGAINHDGGAEIRFHDDGIGVLPNSIGDEIFFPISVLSIERMKKRGVPYEFKVVSTVNGREIYFPIYLRSDVIKFLKEKGLRLPSEG